VSGAIVEIDGSTGEGGGQILRSSLSLSLVTGRPVAVRRIRAARDSPGLARQHLTAVRAAAEVGGAEVEGAERSSTEVVFRPGRLRPGTHRFSTGGAGSAILVLQTLLPALIAAGEPSRVTVEGGTHNPFAPPYDFFARSFLPQLRRTGPEIASRLERPGFYPAGGGRVELEVRPGGRADRLELEERGVERGRRARAIVSALPRHIAEREVSVAHAMLDMRPDAMEVVEIPDEEARGPGNAVMIELAFAAVTAVFTGFGRKGVPAEEVASEAAREARSYLEAGVPVDPHLADQILLPLATGGGGRFVTTEPTSHARTNAWVIGRFTGREPEFRSLGDGRWRVEVPAPDGS
jgi:RNA 3'-terminal phosphate cyclase (ATP)